MQVAAPGKLILSGEHAVVHGAPALAMAVNCHATAVISRDATANVRIDLTSIPHYTLTTFAKLRKLKKKLKAKYQRFMQGDFTIRDVLREPYELAQFALGVMTDALSLQLPYGVNIRLDSDIPIGCGMGSSAATILSIMYVVKHFLHLPLSPEKLFDLALQVENLQHGHSSGFDLKIIQSGGCLYVNHGIYEKRPLPTLPLFLVNTGSPKSTTGECVEVARPCFKSAVLLDEFSKVTQAVDQALLMSDANAFRQALQQNQALLTHLGVVPKRVQQFIAGIDQSGGAAKICGAGSVHGDAAGMVLVSHDEETVLSQLVGDFGYSWRPLVGEERGVYVL